MRLTPTQIQAILQTVSGFTGGTAEVFLFGSRLDDRARGGDIDLLIETAAPLALLERARIKMALESQVGLPVDLVSQARDSVPTPFQRMARANAVRLETP
ncbi:DNA polymerase beta [Gammaproteobacteria bacterium]